MEFKKYHIQSPSLLTGSSDFTKLPEHFSFLTLKIQENIMNKAELIESMQSCKCGCFESKAQAERALNCVIECITNGIKKEGSVQLIGFGTFVVKTRAARSGRNPATGKEIKIKASKVVRFKVGASLKETAKKSK
jgi:DNA-binding protein HU-beta